MKIVKWNSNIPSVWPSFFDDDLVNWPNLSDSNDLEVYETDDSVVVKAAVPGIPEKDVEVTVEGNILTINASYEESEEEKNEKKTIYKSSRRTSFNYSTSLPRTVDSTKANAEVENGVVKVIVPKTEEVKPKKIEVKKKG
jgi:HSP20 family protein